MGAAAAATSNTVFARLIRGGVEFLSCGGRKKCRKTEMRAPQREGDRRKREGRIQRRTDQGGRTGGTSKQAARAACVRACSRARASSVARRQFPGSGTRRKEGRAREEEVSWSSSPPSSPSSSLCVTSSRWPLGLPNAMMKGMRTHTAAEAGRPHNAGRPRDAGLRGLTQPSGPLTVAGGRGEAHHGPTDA